MGAIPADAIVYGITGRVLSTIGGATSLEVGVAGSTDRYGSGIGTSAGSWTRGITGTPLAYYAPTDLVLSAIGGNFDGSGTIRSNDAFFSLARQYTELSKGTPTAPPLPVPATVAAAVHAAFIDDDAAELGHNEIDDQEIDLLVEALATGPKILFW